MYSSKYRINKTIHLSVPLTPEHLIKVTSPLLFRTELLGEQNTQAQFHLKLKILKDYGHAIHLLRFTTYLKYPERAFDQEEVGVRRRICLEQLILP